jgi:hypothetical protein
VRARVQQEDRAGRRLGDAARKFQVSLL